MHGGPHTPILQTLGTSWGGRIPRFSQPQARLLPGKKRTTSRTTSSMHKACHEYPEYPLLTLPMCAVEGKTHAMNIPLHQGNILVGTIVATS